mmetsp:Transcript_67008/g.169193  ORF Transcript_67008/g.169193 Transcript_67008/m.169193 type:complete len:347 (-) Transcript_67008:31-1071(-)
MGSTCSCHAGNKDDETTTLDAGYTNEVGLGAPKDIIKPDGKLPEESPTEIANTDAAEGEVNESNAEPPKVDEQAPGFRVSSDSAHFHREVGNEASGDNGEEEFQERTYKELVRRSGEPEEQAKPGKVTRRPSSENITFDDYTKKHAHLFDKVLELEKPDGWVLKKEVESVSIYTKEMPGQRLLYFKGTTEMPVAGGIPEALKKLFKTEDRPKWDDLCSYAETPQYYPPLYKYAYAQLNAPAPIISKRDILTLGRFRFEADGAVVVALHSEELKDAYPSRSDYVRVNFKEGGYVIRPKNEKGDVLHVTWTGLVDPQGWLPTWVVNHAVIKQGLSLAKLRSYILSTSK